MRLDDAVRDYETWLRSVLTAKGAVTMSGRLGPLVRALGPERELVSIGVDDVQRAAAEAVNAPACHWRKFWQYLMSRGYVTDPAPGQALHGQQMSNLELLSSNQLGAVWAFQPQSYEQHVGICLLALALCGVPVLVVRYLTTDMARLDWRVLAYNPTGGRALDAHAVRRLRAWLEIRAQRGEQRALFTMPDGQPLTTLALRATLGDIARLTGVTYQRAWQHWRVEYEQLPLLQSQSRTGCRQRWLYRRRPHEPVSVAKRLHR